MRCHSSFSTIRKTSPVEGEEIVRSLQDFDSFICCSTRFNMIGTRAFSDWPIGLENHMLECFATKFIFFFRLLRLLTDLITLQYFKCALLQMCRTFQRNFRLLEKEARLQTLGYCLAL